MPALRCGSIVRLPVPPRPAAVLLRGVAAAVPARGQRAVDGVRRSTAGTRDASTSPTCWARRWAPLAVTSCCRGWAPSRRCSAVALCAASRPRLLSRAAARARRAGRGARAGGARSRCRTQRRSSASAARPPRACTGTWPRTRSAKIALTGWNAYSRIDAVTGFARRAWRASTSTPTPGPTCTAGTATWRASAASARPGSARCRSRVAPQAKTLVIGPGGGSDVLVALGSGSQSVTAVEMNPLMLRFVRHFGAEAGNLYDHPQVRDHPLRGPQLPEPHRPHVRRDLPGLRGLVGGGRLGRALAVGELPLHDRGVPRLLRPPDAPTARSSIMRWTEDVPRLVSNAVALLGRRGGAPARRGGDGEARRRRDDPPQMIFMLAQAAVHRGRDGDHHGRLDGREPVIVPGRARRGRLRRPALAAARRWTQYVDEARRAGGPGVRRPALLLRARRSRGACRRA